MFNFQFETTSTAIRLRHLCFAPIKTASFYVNSSNTSLYKKDSLKQRIDRQWSRKLLCHSSRFLIGHSLNVSYSVGYWLKEKSNLSELFDLASDNILLNNINNSQKEDQHLD